MDRYSFYTSVSMTVDLCWAGLTIQKSTIHRKMRISIVSAHDKF